jgi:hypothetical protein
MENPRRVPVVRVPHPVFTGSTGPNQRDMSGAGKTVIPSHLTADYDGAEGQALLADIGNAINTIVDPKKVPFGHNAGVDVVLLLCFFLLYSLANIFNNSFNTAVNATLTYLVGSNNPLRILWDFIVVILVAVVFVLVTLLIVMSRHYRATQHAMDHKIKGFDLT